VDTGTDRHAETVSGTATATKTTIGIGSDVSGETASVIGIETAMVTATVIENADQEETEREMGSVIVTETGIVTGTRIETQSLRRRRRERDRWTAGRQLQKLLEESH
jgi:hypothetical protein